MKGRAAITACVIAGLCLMDAAFAGAPTRSLRPVTREHVFPVALPSFAPDRSVRPVVRPDRQTRKVAAAAAVAPVTLVPPVAKKKPDIKPAPTQPFDPLEAAMPQRDGLDAKPSKEGKNVGNGMVRLCRDRKLIGKEIAPVPARVAGCGISKGAIQLYEVNGVKLSTPAVMRCETAQSLSKWIENGVEPAVKRYGGGVVELKVAAGYACRTRNNRKGAKISEHGKGNAIDIAAFRLKNGDEISVLKDWGGGKKGRILKKMHKNACGPFGTVLGPRADRYHKDHFHLDVARHRGGPYCR